MPQVTMYAPPKDPNRWQMNVLIAGVAIVILTIVAFFGHSRGWDDKPTPPLSRCESSYLDYYAANRDNPLLLSKSAYVDDCEGLQDAVNELREKYPNMEVSK